MCNFIMIMILLVTAYTVMWIRGGDRTIQMVTPRVTHMVIANTSDKLACALSGGVPAGPLPSCPAGGRVIWQQLAARSAGSSMYRPQQ